MNSLTKNSLPQVDYLRECLRDISRGSSVHDFNSNFDPNVESSRFTSCARRQSIKKESDLYYVEENLSLLTIFVAEKVRPSLFDDKVKERVSRLPLFLPSFV